MELSEIKSLILNLPPSERGKLLQEFQDMDFESSTDYTIQHSRQYLLNNKQGVCSHCGHTKYVKFGFKSGSQRYKCKSCKKSFTEYSGTWMAGIHHKGKMDDYLKLMVE